jgi:hypothetical protein
MNKITKILTFSMILILVMQLFLPLINVAHAEETKTEEKTIESNMSKYVSKLKGNLTYDRALHLELTKMILKNKPFVNPTYEQLYVGETTGNLGNANLQLAMLDGAKDSPLANQKGIIRVPIYNKDETQLELGSLYNKNIGTGLSGFVGFDGITNPTYLGKDKIIQINDLVKYSGASIHGDDSRFRYLHVKSFTDIYKNNFKSKTNPYTNNLFVDSYGNVVTNNLDIVIPYWLNSTIDEFNDGDMFKNKGNNTDFISSAILSDPKILGDAYFKSSIVKNDFGVREFEAAIDNSSNMPEPLRNEFKKLFVNTEKEPYVSNKKKKLSDDYAAILTKIYDKDGIYIDMLAEYIVNISGTEVSKFNNNLIDSIIKAEKDGKDLESYMDNGFGRNPNANNGIDTKDEALEYIYSAEGVLEQIGRIFDVGLFHLIKLTIAGFISDFYNSTIINFSVGEVFSTTLLSDSALWKKIVNSVLLLTVSFMTVYLVLLIVRMFMGYITIKGIIQRFIILALAAISPILVYSPLVDVAFNKPSELVLSTEMDRMLVLDGWLTQWEKQEEELKEKNPGFAAPFNTRERSEEYTIPFYTSKHLVSSYSLNTEEGRKDVGPKPNTKDIVVVNVSAFHLFEWLREPDGGSLFEYLNTTHGSEYDGIDSYEEYAYVSEIDFGNGNNYKTKAPLTASQLMKNIHSNVEDDFSTVYFNDTLYDLLDNLLLENDYSNDAINTVLFDISSTNYTRNIIYNNDSDSYAPLTDEMIKELTDFTRPESDLLGLESVIADIKPFRMDESSEIATEVQQINMKVIDDYISNYLTLRKSIDKNDNYLSAEKDVLMLNTFFAVNEVYDIHLFPTHIDTSSITLDTYIRSLLVPLSSFTPYETNLDNIANYVSITSDILASLVFVTMVLLLFLYGMVKFLVLFAILMPLILASFFYNYVWLENKNSKAWVGALGILGSFALVNLGLLVLWKGLIYLMNMTVLDPSGLGVSRYPIVISHSALLVLYLILAFKLILKPLFNTVKGDMKNLGGTKMADGALNFAGNMKGSMKNFWDNMSDSNSVKGRLGNALGNTKLGNAMSALKSAGDSLKGPKSKDKGMAGKLDANQIKSNKTESENEKDKAEVEKVTRKLEESSNNNKGGSALKTVLAAGAGAAVGAAVGKSASEVVGSNALVRMLGLNGLRNNLNNSNRRSLKDTISDTKDSAVKGWKDHEQLSNAMVLSEKLDSIPNIDIEKVSYDSEEFETLETMGLDTVISETQNNLDVSPLVLDLGDNLSSNLLANALSTNGTSAVSSDGKVVIDGNNELMETAEGRKALFTPVLEKIESEMVGLNSLKTPERENLGIGVIAEKLSEKAYRIEGNELTGDIENYVNKMKSEGVGVTTRRNEDGSLEMVFQNAQVAEESIRDIESKSSVLAKHKGIKLGESTFDVNSNSLNSLTTKLDNSGISYNTSQLVNGSTSIEVLGGSEQLSKFNEIVSSDSEISNGVREITDGIDVIKGNSLVTELVRERIASGELVEGKDVILRNDSVYAKSDEAKRALYDVKDSYAGRVDDTVSELQDLAVTVTRTIVGDGGISISDYEEGTSEHLDSLVSSSTIGREKYLFDNRNVDMNNLNKIVDDISKKKLKSDKSFLAEQQNYEEAKALKEEAHANKTILPVKIAAVNGEINQLSSNFQSVVRDGNLSTGEVQKLTEEHTVKLEELSNNLNELERKEDLYKTNLADFSSKEIKFKQAETNRTKEFSDVELKLIGSINRAKSKGISWDRVSNDKVEFVSEIRGQEDLVTEIMQSYSEVSKLNNNSKNSGKKDTKSEVNKNVNSGMSNNS